MTALLDEPDVAAFDSEPIFSRSPGNVEYISGYVYGQGSALLEIIPLAAAIVSLGAVLALLGFFLVISSFDCRLPCYT